MFSHFGVVGVVVLHLHLQDFGEPGVVVVVYLNANHAAPLAAAAKEHVNRVGVVAGVPAKPQLGPLLSDRGPQELERM